MPASAAVLFCFGVASVSQVIAKANSYNVQGFYYGLAYFDRALILHNRFNPLLRCLWLYLFLYLDWFPLWSGSRWFRVVLGFWQWVARDAGIFGYPIPGAKVGGGYVFYRFHSKSFTSLNTSQMKIKSTASPIIAKSFRICNRFCLFAPR